jgi:hypothetical protein
MRILVPLIFLFAAIPGISQVDTNKILRAFPITDYMVDLNDSTKIVQLEMPDGVRFADKQLGVLKGTYQNKHSDTAQKGYGRCHLIKGDFYYFSIIRNTSGLSPAKGDLLYTLMDKNKVFGGRFQKLASHFILLKNVYEGPLYDRYLIFQSWTEKEESAKIDSMKADIRFTGKYFQENNNSMDSLITSGPFKGKRLLQVMKECKRNEVESFLDYMIARPRLYAGREWLVPEIFATWLANGAPGGIHN